MIPAQPPLAARRWDVVDIDFGNPVGHEQGKHRPAIVLSNDAFNRATGLVCVLPISSARISPKYPAEVAIADMPGILTAGVVLVQQIRTVSAGRITGVRGPAKDPVLHREIREALWAFCAFEEDVH